MTPVELMSLHNYLQYMYNINNVHKTVSSLVLASEISRCCHDSEIIL